MRIVIDTNVLLVSVSGRSRSYRLYLAFQKRKFELAFTTEILAEYEEQFALHWKPSVAENILSTIVNAPNSVATTIFYNLRLMTTDPGDNKFSGCAFASNTDYLFTNDSDFGILKKTDSPEIHVVSLDEFKQILLHRNLLEP